MLDNTSSEFDHRPITNGPLFQWLGVQWQGGHYAVSLNCISAVFKTKIAENAQLDLAVHDGAVVFMKPFSECFAIPPNFQVAKEPAQWAIVLNSALPETIGCRVHSVVGPFWAKTGLVALEHAGQQWTVVQQSGAAHA